MCGNLRARTIYHSHHQPRSIRQLLILTMITHLWSVTYSPKIAITSTMMSRAPPSPLPLRDPDQALTPTLIGPQTSIPWAVPGLLRNNTE
jgi:hypothetical protein